MYAYPGDTLPEVRSDTSDSNPREIPLPGVFLVFTTSKYLELEINQIGITNLIQGI
jgi:hypothetical protein